MALITKAIKGTKDVLPQDAYKSSILKPRLGKRPPTLDTKRSVPLCLSTRSCSSEAWVTPPMWCKRDVHL